MCRGHSDGETDTADNSMSRKRQVKG